MSWNPPIKELIPSYIIRYKRQVESSNQNKLVLLSLGWGEIAVYTAISIQKARQNSLCWRSVGFVDLGPGVALLISAWLWIIIHDFSAVEYGRLADLFDRLNWQSFLSLPEMNPTPWSRHTESRLQLLSWVSVQIDIESFVCPYRRLLCQSGRGTSSGPSMNKSSAA